MKVLLLTIFALAFFSSSAVPGGWQLATTEPDPRLLQNLKTCLSQITQKEKSLSFVGAKIGDIYLHFTQVVNGINHKITFRTEANGAVKLVQVVYNENFFGEENQRVSLIDYTIFDDSASEFFILTSFILFYIEFSALSSTQEENLEEAIVRTMSILKPDVQSYVKTPFISSAFAGEVHGRDFYHVKTVVQGTDNRISLYEFWFKKLSGENLEIVNEPEIFAYVPLKISQQSMEQRGNLAENNTNCLSVSSYFLCSVLSQCDSGDFIATSQCKNREDSIYG